MPMPVILPWMDVGPPPTDYSPHDPGGWNTPVTFTLPFPDLTHFVVAFPIGYHHLVIVPYLPFGSNYTFIAFYIPRQLRELHYG